MALTTSLNADPEFTVQYWANVAVVNPDGIGDKLDVIDTSGGKIPENGEKDPELTYLALNDDGTIIEKDELMEVYSSKKFTFLKYPGLTYVNRLKDNKGYTLKELWVLEEGDPNSAEEAGWKKYSGSALESVTFTNNPDSAGGNTILITNDTVIRLVFDQNTNTYTNDVNLFDYDIAEGTGGDSSWDTAHYGINNANNYRNNNNNTDPRYAFGNARAGVSYAWDLFNGSTINMGNGSTSGGNTWGKDTYKRLSFWNCAGITEEGRY